MNAAQIVELYADDGINGVIRELGCTRRQAEHVTALARKAFAQGRNLSPDEIPMGTVARAKAIHPATIGRALTDEETADLPGAYVDPAMRTYEGQHEKSRQTTIIKNIENGYVEWFPQVKDPTERERLRRLVKERYNITIPMEAMRHAG